LLLEAEVEPALGYRVWRVSLRSDLSWQPCPSSHQSAVGQPPGPRERSLGGTAGCVIGKGGCWTPRARHNSTIAR